MMITTHLEQLHNDMTECQAIMMRMTETIQIIKDQEIKLQKTITQSESITYSIGDHFRRKLKTGEITGETYILSQVGEQLIVLIGVDSSNRWYEPVTLPVKYSAGKIPQHVFDQLMGPIDSWIRIEKWK